MPPGPKWKTKDQKEEYLTRLAELNLKRWSQVRMARDLGVSRRQIIRDIKIIRRRWLDTQIDSIGERRRQELHAVALVEKEAWGAWDKSKEDAETRTQKAKKAEAGGQGNPIELSIRTEGKTGDAIYLKTVLECSRERRKLLGTDAPEQINVDLTNHTTEELVAERERLRRELQIPPGTGSPPPGGGEGTPPSTGSPGPTGPTPAP